MSGPIEEIVSRLPSTVRIVPMVVIATSPQLLVQINGDTTTTMPAKSITGAVSAGATGFAIWSPPIPPLVFATGADTGWVSASYVSGFSAGTPGQLEVRAVGNQVWIRGGADHTTNFTNGDTVATIPASSGGISLRPAETVRLMGFGSNRRAVAVDINTDGTVVCGWPDPPGTGGTSSIHDPWPTSWVGIDHTYLTD